MWICTLYRFNLLGWTASHPTCYPHRTLGEDERENTPSVEAPIPWGPPVSQVGAGGEGLKALWDYGSSRITLLWPLLGCAGLPDGRDWAQFTLVLGLQ